jgi:hypothetical protein
LISNSAKVHSGASRVYLKAGQLNTQRLNLKMGDETLNFSPSLYVLLYERLENSDELGFVCSIYTGILADAHYCVRYHFWLVGETQADLE